LNRRLNMSIERILLIGHNGTRTGAPAVLLNLAKWLARSHPEISIDILLMTGGPLADEYRKYGDVHAMYDAGEGIGAKIKRRLTSSLPHFKRRYDIVLGNTIVTLALLDRFKERGFTTAAWLHELDSIIRSCCAPEEFKRLIERQDAVIVPSAVFSDMFRRFDIDVEPAIAHDFIVNDGAPDTVPFTHTELGVPEGSFIAAAAGTVEWRKGTDLFLQIAKIVLERRKDVRFIWVGADTGDEKDRERIEYDAARMGFGDSVKFIPATPEYRRIVAAADVFTLTSREDPCPLVALDAADLAKPVICFEGAGAAAELVADGAGTAVPYGSAERFAEAILSYREDRGKLRAAGIAAKAKVTDVFTADASCSIIFDTISNAARGRIS